MRILKYGTRFRWTAVDREGCILGYVYKDGLNGGYTCVVGGVTSSFDDRADALLKLSVSVDKKERHLA